MAKIYVSSTYVDLKEYREQVRIALRSIGHEDVAMEYYTAGEERPVDKCLADVAMCDVYVGIFAFRYGYIPKKQKKSVTEQEYRTAVKLGKPCLIFLLKEDASWPLNHVEINQIAKINKLRKELSDKHQIGLFADKNDLAKQVTAAVYNWALKHGHIPATVATIPQFDLEAYLTALRKRYGVLALEGLTPPQKEEYLQIHLRSIFIEQNVRENPPPVELPKEMLEKLKREGQIHPDDLPDGITLDDVRKARDTYYQKQSQPVLDILTDTRYGHTIILGDPGSGKSTLTRYITLALIDPTGDEKLCKAFDGYIPLLVELRTFAGLCAEQKCETFLEFLEYLGKTEGWHLTKDALHNYLLKDGKAIVIFDGLDEIFDPEIRERITRQIAGFMNDYPKARIIVTSRVIGYRRKILTDAGFTHFTLADFDERQVEAFVTRWYDLALSDRPEDAKQRRERILDSFKQSSSIRQLAGNPMLLTIMAIIGKHQELPRERWKLYDHAASVLIQHWDVNKHLEKVGLKAGFIGEEDKKELLRRLAFMMQEGSGGLAGNYIHRDQLQAEFEGYLSERYQQSPVDAKVIARKMIEQFRERNFILSLYGANVYGFVHRAFLEFFCASAFVNKFEKKKELTIEQLKEDVYGKHWLDQSWHEVLRLICGMVDEKWAEEFIIFLCNQKISKGTKAGANVALALYCLSEVRMISSLKGASEAFIRAVIKSFEFNPEDSHAFDDDKETALLLRSIGRILPDKEGLARMLEKYKVPQGYISSSATFGNFVGYVGMGIKNVLNVLHTYIGNMNSNYRVIALRALAIGFRDDAGTLPLLLNCAVKDNDDDVRWTAILLMALQYRDEAGTLSLIRKLATKDKITSIRWIAIRLLAQQYHDDAGTLSLLHERAVIDEYIDVRREALRQLAQKYRDNAGTLPMLRERAIKDDHELVRKTAIEHLASLYSDDERTLPLLRERAVNDDNFQVRRTAIANLAHRYRDDVGTLSLLRERAIKDEHEHVRCMAIEQLVQQYRDDPSTLPLLYDLSKNDPETSVILKAAMLIGDIKRNQSAEKGSK